VAPREGHGLDPQPGRERMKGRDWVYLHFNMYLRDWILTEKENFEAFKVTSFERCQNSASQFGSSCTIQRTLLRAEAIWGGSPPLTCSSSSFSCSFLPTRRNANQVKEKGKAFATAHRKTRDIWGDHRHHTRGSGFVPAKMAGEIRA
jgi:hypothetical protein